MALALWHNRQFSSYRGPPACAAISKCAQIQSLGQDTPTQASVRARRPDPLSGAPPPPFHARVEASKSRIFRVGIERPSEDLAALGGGRPRRTNGRHWQRRRRPRGRAENGQCEIFFERSGGGSARQQPRRACPAGASASENLAEIFAKFLRKRLPAEGWGGGHSCACRFSHLRTHAFHAGNRATPQKPFARPVPVSSFTFTGAFVRPHSCLPSPTLVS